MFNNRIDDKTLEHVNGGIKKEDIPNYDLIKKTYFEWGANRALCMGQILFCSDFAYDVVWNIEDELRAGDRSYTIDGVHYDCPEHDPYFKNEGHYIRFAHN